MPTVPRSRRVCIVCDLKRYSPHSDHEHGRLQQVLSQALDSACDTALGALADQAQHQPQGDGRLIVLPSGIDEPKVIRRFLAEFGQELRVANREIRDDSRARVRVAIDEGMVSDRENGFGGDPPILAGELCNSPEVRAALDESAADHVVAVSDSLFVASVRDAFDDLAERLFRRISVTGKRRPLAAWLHIPDQDPATPAAPQRRAPTIGGGGLVPD